MHNCFSLSNKVRMMKTQEGSSYVNQRRRTNAMEQLDFDKLRYFVYPVILRVNLYFVLLKSFFGSAAE